MVNYSQDFSFTWEISIFPLRTNDILTKLTLEIHHSICTLSGKLAVFGQETPNKQPCNEAKNCPKQHEQADTHQEAGSPARLSQVLGHHHIIFKLTVLSLLKAVRSLDSSFNSGQASLARVSLMMSVSHPGSGWLLATVPVSVSSSGIPGILLSPAAGVLTLNTSLAWSSGTTEIISRTQETSTSNVLVSCSALYCVSRIQYTFYYKNIWHHTCLLLHWAEFRNIDAPRSRPSITYMHGLIFSVFTWGAHLLRLASAWTPAVWAIFLVAAHKNVFLQI